MILTGNTLKELFTSKTWKCNKDPESIHYNPNSIDVTLSPYIYFTKANPNILDPMKSRVEDYFYLKQVDSFVLRPQQFILASVNESFDSTAPYEGKYFSQIYDGRSTIARLGIMSHISAGFGDYGFKGAFTLEVVNNSPFPIKLYSGMRIGQVYFTELDKNANSLIYSGYNHSDGIPGLPRIGEGRF